MLAFLEGVEVEAEPADLCILYPCPLDPFPVLVYFSSLSAFTLSSQLLPLFVKHALGLVEMLRTKMPGICNLLVCKPLTKV